MSEEMKDDELMAKVDTKIKHNLINWEKLSEKEQSTTAEIIVRSAIFKHKDEFIENFLDSAKAISTGICPRCNKATGLGEDCLICDIVRKASEAELGNKDAV